MGDDRRDFSKLDPTIANTAISNRLDGLRRLQAIPRLLSAAQKQQIADKVKHAQFPCGFFVSSLLGDNESQTYAANFVDAFRLGGCDTKLSFNGALRTDLVGLFIVHDDSPIGIEGAALLRSCLEGLPVRYDNSLTTDPNFLFFKGFGLLVGRKPN